MKWWLYMIRCDDDSLYTGISTDVDRRFQEHLGATAGKHRGAKFFNGRKPLAVVYQEEHPDRSSASVREYEIKQLSRRQKMKLINQ